MKLIFIEQQQKSNYPVFFLKPDTALLRNNQAFFYPDFTRDLQANIALVLHVSRLGRSISERFAERYFDAVGVGIDLLANDLLGVCRAQGLAWEPARCFDYSAPICPKFLPLSEINNCRLLLNKKEVINLKIENLSFSFSQIIAYISKFMTLKIGDYIFVNAPTPAVPLKIDDELTAFIGQKEMLRMTIK